MPSNALVLLVGHRNHLKELNWCPFGHLDLSAITQHEARGADLWQLQSYGVADLVRAVATRVLMDAVTDHANHGRQQRVVSTHGRNELNVGRTEFVVAAKLPLAADPDASHEKPIIAVSSEDLDLERRSAWIQVWGEAG